METIYYCSDCGSFQEAQQSVYLFSWVLEEAILKETAQKEQKDKIQGGSLGKAAQESRKNLKLGHQFTTKSPLEQNKNFESKALTKKNYEFLFIKFH